MKWRTSQHQRTVVDAEVSAAAALTQVKWRTADTSTTPKTWLEDEEHALKKAMTLGYSVSALNVKSDAAGAAKTSNDGVVKEEESESERTSRRALKWLTAPPEWASHAKAVRDVRPLIPKADTTGMTRSQSDKALNKSCVLEDDVAANTESLLDAP